MRGRTEPTLPDLDPDRVETEEASRLPPDDLGGPRGDPTEILPELPPPPSPRRPAPPRPGPARTLLWLGLAALVGLPLLLGLAAVVALAVAR